MGAYKPQTDDEITVYNLYQELLRSWNEQNAENYGNLFIDNGSIIGFDGSEMNGRKQIAETISGIFAHHKTNSYVSKVREIRFLGSGVVLLRAVAGMFPRDKPQIMPAVNTIQSLVAVREKEAWRIALLQNTPAQFHGRPELSEALTRELQELL